MRPRTIEQRPLSGCCRPSIYTLSGRISLLRTLPRSTSAAFAARSFQLRGMVKLRHESRTMSLVFVKRTMALETASFLVHSIEDVLNLGIELLDSLLVSLSGPYKPSYFGFDIHELREWTRLFKPFDASLLASGKKAPQAIRPGQEQVNGFTVPLRRRISASCTRTPVAGPSSPSEYPPLS